MRREKAQLAGLLQGVRLGVRVPFQRLPALAALFLAEGAAALCHPGTPLYAPVAKHLLRAASVDMQVTCRRCAALPHPF